MISRRSFLERGSLALAAMTVLDSRAAAANAGTGPLGRPIGLQLYTVRQDANKDLTGTLAQIAAIGYREVETAGFYGKSGKELRKILDRHGLTAPSSHFSMADLQTDLQAKIDDVAALGAKYFVCAFPALPPGAKLPAGKNIANGMSLDDWKWNAEQLNRIGEATHKAGLRTGYHNHNMEFRTFDGSSGYDRLLAWTDPKLVTFEMDLAWVVTAGVDPVPYLQKHANRISLLHVKEVKKDARIVADELVVQTTEVGKGRIDWKRIFAACDPKHLKHYFVEQENFDRPALEAVRISYDYLRGLKA
jgi:sugar phosphate isomerase/epimerase